jgi:hypothetical protein
VTGGTAPPAADPALAAARALRQAAGAVAAARHSRPELAPVLQAATRDLYTAMRGLARYQVTGQPPGTGPGTLPGQIRDAARSAGLAWRSLAAANAGQIVPAEPASGPARALSEAAASAVRAWHRPAGSARDREEIVELVTAAAAAMAATVGYLATGTAGLAACRFRHAERSLEIAAEQLRQALACARADHPCPVPSPWGSSRPGPARRRTLRAARIPVAQRRDRRRFRCAN